MCRSRAMLVKLRSRRPASCPGPRPAAAVPLDAFPGIATIRGVQRRIRTRARGRRWYILRATAGVYGGSARGAAQGTRHQRSAAGPLRRPAAEAQGGLRLQLPGAHQHVGSADHHGLRRLPPRDALAGLAGRQLVRGHPAAGQDPRRERVHAALPRGQGAQPARLPGHRPGAAHRHLRARDAGRQGAPLHAARHRGAPADLRGPRRRAHAGDGRRLRGAAGTAMDDLFKDM